MAMSARFRGGATGVVLVLAITVSALALGAGSGRAAPRAPGGPSVSLPVGIRASHVRGLDRVVFDFVGAVGRWAMSIG
jgi:hypothetical protein